jgi:hypothetical protein
MEIRQIIAETPIEKSAFMGAILGSLYGDTPKSRRNLQRRSDCKIGAPTVGLSDIATVSKTPTKERAKK